jgi:hypothetical protein
VARARGAPARAGGEAMNRTCAPRRLVIGALLAASACTVACAPAPDDPPEVQRISSLYVPGLPVAIPTDAATGFGTVNERGPASDGCKTDFGPPGTAGTLTVTFTTQVIGQLWQPANVGAVWIERVDPAAPDDFTKDRFVRAIEIWAGLRLPSLETYETRTCSNFEPAFDPDAIVTPTLADHTKMHTSMWDGKDINGQVVPDGTYKVFVEVTEFEEQGPITFATFQKGPTPATITVPDGQATKNLVLNWAPGMGLMGPGGL